MSDDLVIHVAGIFGVQAIRFLRAGGGFSEAAVYQVTDADGDQFAVRGTPIKATQPYDRLLALHRLLSLIHDDGIHVIPVPLPQLRPVHTEADNRLNLFSGSSIASLTIIVVDDKLWQVEPWMTGACIQGSPTSAQVSRAMHSLFEFHSSAKRSALFCGRNEWFYTETNHSPGVERRLAIATELSSGLMQEYKRAFANHPDLPFRMLALRVLETLNRWLPWLVRQLRAISRNQYSLQPVIRDLWKAHVLYSGDEVTGLIDLSAMATDHVCFDLSRLLRSWFGSDTSQVRSAVEIFTALRTLDLHEQSLMQALDAATVLLSPVTWLRRRLQQPADSASSATVLQRLAELVDVAERFEPL